MEWNIPIFIWSQRCHMTLPHLVATSAGALVLLGNVPGGVHPAVRVQHRPLYPTIGLNRSTNQGSCFHSKL